MLMFKIILLSIQIDKIVLYYNWLKSNFVKVIIWKAMKISIVLINFYLIFKTMHCLNVQSFFLVVHGNGYPQKNID